MKASTKHLAGPNLEQRDRFGSFWGIIVRSFQSRVVIWAGKRTNCPVFIENVSAANQSNFIEK